MKIPYSLYSKFMAPLQGCECCKCNRTLESNTAHHIYYRSIKKLLAIVKKNTLPVCFECHEWFHENKFRAYEWIDDNFPNLRVELCEIEEEIRSKKMKPQEIYEKWGT